MENSQLILQLQQKVDDYHLRPQTIQLVQQTPIVLLVGVTGAGKDTIKQALLKDHDYHHIVSHTTRQPRENKGVMEHDGIEYHFIDVPTASTMLDNHGFIEAKMYSGNVYGTSVGEIQLAHDEGKIAITDIEVQGVEEFHAISPSMRPVFILPPSFEVWQQRLLSRYEGKPDPEDLERRLQTAKLEIEFVLATDYFYVVVNDDLQTAISQVDSIARGTDVPRRSAHAENIMRDILAHL